jgi:hypothetical protein
LLAGVAEHIVPVRVLPAKNILGKKKLAAKSGQFSCDKARSVVFLFIP